MATVPALTVHQPYAHLIAAGRKPIETRTWATRYRGPLLIHASKRRAGAPLDLPRGQVVALVDLVDVRPLRVDDEAAACTPYKPGRFAWVLDNVVRLEPGVPCRGMQGLWRPSAEVLAACFGGRAAQPGVMVRRLQAVPA